MKVRIVIPLWKRPDVTKYCFDALKKLIAKSKHELDVLCVISEPEYINICERYGFNWVAAPNDPLGEKINSGIRRALFYKWDYLMMMNSDNVIDIKLIDDVYQPFFESLNPYFGINRVTYVKFGTEEARDVTYEDSILGIAKCVRRDIVEKAFKEVGYLYIPDRNRGLDDSMMDTLINMGVKRTFVKYDGLLAMDFKSELNLWPWEHFKNEKAVCYKAG